jgi:hypothetical protein
MARARNIKPSFFKNFDLADQGPLAQLLFAGLWCLADKEGRLKDQPRYIKAEIFPYYDCDVNGELTKLQREGFIRRYESHGIAVVEIINFKKHQSPHHTEKDSQLPAFDSASVCKQTRKDVNRDLTVNPPKQDGGNPSDSLIPDSLIPSSLIPDSPKEDSPIPDSKTVAPPKNPATPAKTSQVWESYATEFFARYGTEPVRNSKVNGMLAKLVDRLGADEAPLVAAFFVRSNRGLYVSSKHAIDLLLRDAEGIRTEWATNRSVTDTEARQTDQTQAAANVWLPLIEEAKRKEEAARREREAMNG